MKHEPQQWQTVCNLKSQTLNECDAVLKFVKQKRAFLIDSVFHSSLPENPLWKHVKKFSITMNWEKAQ